MPKTLTPALQTYLSGFATSADRVLKFADLFTVTLQGGSVPNIATGQVLTWTDYTDPVVWNGATYAANSVLVSGLKYKANVGVNADSQEITFAARNIDTIGGIPFLAATANGLLDGAEIQRERAFFALAATPPYVPIGTILLFKGRVTKIGSIGRTQATATVESDLTLLKQQMPRNFFSPSCVWQLYGPGCQAAVQSFPGAVGAGSTAALINWGGASANFAQGKLVFTSGANTGVTVSVKAATSSALIPVYPLPSAPSPGDAFNAVWGCDHTKATCASRFNNLANFRGFPGVPPPQVVTGPLATTANAGKG